MNKILILFAHPAAHKSRIHKVLADVAQSVSGVTLHNLYNQYPDFYINVKREQQLLLEHDIIVWQHPLFWYSCPSLMKEWIDVVLEHDFAYGRAGTRLTGKKLLSAISTGGASGVYDESGSSLYTIRQFLAPFHQTAILCGMDYLPPFVVHGSHLLLENELHVAGAQYRRVLSGLRDGDFPPHRMNSVKYINELL